MGIVNIELNKDDIDNLSAALKAMNEVRFNAVVKKNVTQMLNAARHGGTPVDTGELRLSSSAYAPQVEYGHRTVNGRWVSGQRFLKANAETQAFIYYQDLLKAIKKG